VFDDPFYESDPLGFTRWRFTSVTGYDVKVDKNLDRRVIDIDHNKSQVRIRPGESRLRFGGLMALATWDIIGGPRWAPELRRSDGIAQSFRPVLRPAPESTCCAHCRRRSTDIHESRLARRHRQLLNELAHVQAELERLLTFLDTTRSRARVRLRGV